MIVFVPAWLPGWCLDWKQQKLIFWMIDATSENHISVGRDICNLKDDREIPPSRFCWKSEILLLNDAAWTLDEATPYHQTHAWEKWGKMTDNIQITGERSQHSLPPKASRDLWTSQMTRNYSLVSATENAALAPLSWYFYCLFRDVCDHGAGIMKCLSPADNKRCLLPFSLTPPQFPFNCSLFFLRTIVSHLIQLQHLSWVDTQHLSNGTRVNWG